MLSKQLRKLRHDKDLTQKELALKLHVSDAAIAMWESGKRTPDIETIKELAKFFGVTVDYLVDSESEATDTNITDTDLKYALFGDANADDDLLETIKQIAIIQKEMRDKNKKG